MSTEKKQLNVYGKAGKDGRYCGWKNYDTCSVAFWLDNTERLYNKAARWMETHRKSRTPYTSFIRAMRMEYGRNGDGVEWLSRRVSRVEMNRYMRSLPKLEGQP